MNDNEPQEKKLLSKALSSYDSVYNPYNLSTLYPKPFLGDAPYGNGLTNYSTYSYPYQLAANPVTYSEELAQCRFFYKTDPTASTVINRMAELAGAKLKIRRGLCTDEEFAYFSGIIEDITKVLKQAALEYLVAGMAIPDYAHVRTMGNRIDPSLGRKRYIVPEKMWVRNPENIILRRTPFGGDRRIYLQIPRDEISFILNKGVYPDGTKDIELYTTLVNDFPDYVRAINEGKTQIPLPNCRPILRKAGPDRDYPQPFLVPALASLKHKMRIREMDHSIATRAIEAIMHIKAGNDEYPVTEDDPTLDDIRTQMQARSSNAADQLVYRLYTNHTVTIAWLYPQLEALLSPTKYESVDADIFMAMGFSRVLLVGESGKSNAGAGTQIILGPVAMLEEIRGQLLYWTHELFEELAKLNNFVNIPEGYFDQLVLGDVNVLVQQAGTAVKSGAISKDTYARMFGTDYESELRQIEREAELATNSPMINQIVQLGQQPHNPPQTQQIQNPDGTITEMPVLPSDMLNLMGG